MTPSFWRGKRVFVTGHTGFKGSWLSIWLQMLGAHVSGFALPPPTTPSLFDRARIADGMRSREGDVRDLEQLESALSSEQPDILIHMAAQSLVRRSYREPVATYATNVMGTVHVLDALRRVDSVRVALIVTSDKCYENRGVIDGYREEDALGGWDPYSSSKSCGELVASAYRSSFFPPERPPRIATVRAGNVIGGGDWAEDRLIPDLIRAFEAGRTATLRNPEATRPWQFVLEPLAGYLLLAERLWAGDAGFAEAWNFGADRGEVRPVSEVADMLVSLWGDGASWRSEEGNHPPEAGYLALDCSKARGRLGWAPRLSLEETLEWVVEWHRASAGGESARRITELQIRRYQDRLDP